MITSRVLSQSTHMEWTLYGPFKHHNDYKELIEDLEAAGEQDVFTLKISSPGGRVDVAMAVIRAIQECKAAVIARIVYKSASMAAILACACDAMVIDKHQYLMFHTFSSGVEGKSDEMLQAVLEDDISIRGEMADIVTPFLSKAELRRIANGKDLYIRWDNKTLPERLKRHFPSMKVAEEGEDTNE